jgi:hypothetical protein
MIPASYQMPAAALLLLAGIISCFFGYRLFRTVLAIFGFIVGGMLASSIVGVGNTTIMLVVWLVGGLIGAFILVFAYFLGVALAGASIGAAVANLLFSVGNRDPGVLVVIFCSVVGAIASMYLQRYFIIVFTSWATRQRCARRRRETYGWRIRSTRHPVSSGSWWCGSP